MQQEHAVGCHNRARSARRPCWGGGGGGTGSSRSGPDPAIAIAIAAAMERAGEAPCTSGAPHTGTTVVAVSYAGGVVIGADSRVSTGTYVSNRASDKITALCDNVYLLRSGSAADTQAVADYGALLDGREALLHGMDACPGRRRPPPLLPPPPATRPRTASAALPSPAPQCGTSQSSMRCSYSARRACGRLPTW